MGQPTGQRAMGRQLAIMGVPMTDKRAMGRLTKTAEWAYRPPPRPPSGYSNRPYAPSSTSPHSTTDAQRAGTLPSATAKSGGMTASRPKKEAKLKLAEAKAKRDGVASLTQEDLKGLSPEQIKQLRGY